MTRVETRTMVRLIAWAPLAAWPATLIAQPSNDHRAGAFAVTLGQSVSGTTEGATNDGGIFGACSQSGAAPDVWYRYDCLASGLVAVSTCGGSPFRTVLQVFNVDPGNGLGVECDVGEQNALSRRVVVSFDDVGGDLNAGALYFVEAACVATDDAQWGNGRNNYATRILNAGTMLSISIGFFGQTYGRTSALELWSRMDASVHLSRVNYVESTTIFTDTWRHWTPSQPYAVQMPAGTWTPVTTNQNARFIAASKVFDNGNGTYDYEYAVLNANSGRAGNQFAVRAASGASAVGFRAPKYHSGDRVLNNPWLNNGGAGGAVRWSVDPATAAYVIPNQSSRVGFEPNTLRWGTMYNFRFRASAPPMTGSARLGLTPPHDGTGFQGSSLAVENLSVPAFCTADVGIAGGMSGADGVLDNNDFIAFIDAFFNSNLLIADVGKAGGLTGPDNQLDTNDFIAYIDGFFAGCN